VRAHGYQVTGYRYEDDSYRDPSEADVGERPPTHPCRAAAGGGGGGGLDRGGGVVEGGVDG